MWILLFGVGSLVALGVAWSLCAASKRSDAVFDRPHNATDREAYYEGRDPHVVPFERKG